MGANKVARFIPAIPVSTKITVEYRSGNKNTYYSQKQKISTSR
jgi:hypothetical protein